MSYRDLRNLCEILRTVGYPRLVSIENFRTPNFPLVADICRWLVLQYEPKADLPANSETEAERVLLIRAFAEFMLINVQVKLNTKRLYQADGYAVKELLKVASVLYNAVREAEFSPSSSKPIRSGPEPDSRVDLKDLKEARSLASTLVQKGVTLYDLLSKESALREARQQALSRAYEHSEIQRLIKSALEVGTQETQKMSSIIDTVQSNLASMDGKIEKKRMELDRSQKRLLTLKKVRPAFMDEYEELQAELSGVYEEYVKRFRALAFLQNQVEEMDRQEEERKAEEMMSKAEFRRKGGVDELLKGPFLHSSSEDDESEENGTDEDVSKGQQVPMPPSRATGSVGGMRGRSRIGANPPPPAATRRVYGSMLGNGTEESDNSESDMILVDGENDNMNSDLDEENVEELVALQKDDADVGSNNFGGYNNNNNNNNNGPLPNGTAVNGGKGYGAESNRTRSRSMLKRPTTSGQKAPPVSDDDEF